MATAGEGWGNVRGWLSDLVQVSDHLRIVGPARAGWELKGDPVVGVNEEGDLMGAERTA